MNKNTRLLVVLIIVLLTSISSKSNAQIISDVNHLNITGIKLYFINFNFKRTLKIVVTSPAELEFIKEIKLPYNFDKSYQFHTLKIKNTGMYYSGIKVSNFDAFKINKGVKTKLKYSKSEKRTKSVLLEQDKFGTFIDILYSTEGIAIGDTVLIDYSYSLPYEENMATLTNCRLFFSDAIDKNHFEFSLSHDKNLKINIATSNVVAPEKRRKENNYITYQWKLENLKGSLLEKKAIPYKTEPYVIISCSPSTFEYTLPNSTQVVPRPLYAVAAYNREASFLSILQSISIGNKNIQYRKLNEFIATNTSQIINDSLGIEKITTLHNIIVKDFKYQNDLDYYDEYDNKDQQLGNFLGKKIIRERSRHNLYIALCKSLGINTLTGYIVDKRSGIMSKQYVAPMFKDEFLIVPILKDNTIRYILPKKDGLSYFMDELPFYYENTLIRLVNLLDYLNKYEPISEKFNSIPTPKSTLKDNKRSHTTMVDINTTTGTAIYNSKINLSGQYSTLTRQCYNSTRKIDNTINPLYGITQWKNIDAKKTAIEQVKSESTFPYKANFKVTFSKEKVLLKENNEITLALKGYFNYITDSELNTDRVLSYYPDFLSFDTYNYFLKLDNPLTLKNPISKTIENKLGKFVIDISQVAPNVIKLSSLFVVNHDEVAAEDINSVIEINGEIKLIDNYILKFSK